MSENEIKFTANIDRRSFLKGIAATGAMATIAAGQPSDAAQATPSAQVASSVNPATKSWKDKPDPIGAYFRRGNL
jgi:anaerobic selenocysteine-containing dehydrogenase